MDELQIKLQVKILQCLPLIELIKLRTICKSWKSMIDVSTKKKELIVFVDTEKRPLKWEFNKQNVNEDNCLIVNTNYSTNQHFIEFFKYVEKLIIFDPTSSIYSLNRLLASFVELRHLQIIINFNQSELEKLEFYHTINFGGHRLESFSFNSFIRFDTINYYKLFDLKSVNLNFLSIDSSLKDGPLNLFKTLKYLKLQEFDLEYQQKIQFDNLEILVCLKPFIILLKNMPKLKQIHFPYFYTDVVKYNNCLKQIESRLGVQEFGRFSKIEFFFSGFKCKTNDYLGSLFRAFMLNLKPFRFYDTINYEVLKLIFNKTMELDLSREPIEYIYTDEFGDQFDNLDEDLIQQLTLNRNRLVRILNKIDNNENLLRSTLLFNNVERLIIGDQLTQIQLNLLPDIFINLNQFEQTSKYEASFTVNFMFLSQFKVLRKFNLLENFISKESFQKILFENKSKLFRIGELARFIFEINADDTIQFKRKRTSIGTFYFNRLYSNKKYETKEQFKTDINHEIDEFIKYEERERRFPLGAAEMVRR